MNCPDSKYDLLRKYTNNASVIEELYTYTENKFANKKEQPDKGSLSLGDDESVPIWEDYWLQSKRIGVFETLKRNLVQLQFPVRKNISQSTAYRDATLKGVLTDSMTAATGLQLKDTSSLKFFIYESFAGKIPVVVATNHEDFVSLIQALTCRNEPVQIPDSMGAAMIKGLNNWDRIRRLKAEWIKNNSSESWRQEFQKNILPNRNFYQDKLIVLSKKPYSGVAAKHFGISEEEWLEHSLKIRLEHECAHLYTLSTFGSMANNMHDELLADYMGITKVTGTFKSDWFLRCLGLKNYPQYREGGRFQNYLNNPPLSNEAVIVLRTIVRNAAINLESFDHHLGLPFDETDRIHRLQVICKVGLLQLSLGDGTKQLLKCYHEVRSLEGLKLNKIYE